MRDEDVAAYLQNNPQFFENYAEMLSGVVIPHPYGGRTISLSERQLLTLREKNRMLEKKLFELVENAKDNDELQAKVHQFTLTLFASRDREALPEVIPRDLCERFAIPHAVLRLWEQSPPSAEVLTFADQTSQPVCVHRAVYDTQSWFGEAGEHLRSFAYLPLRDGEQSIGLLILASEDVQRFYPEMGTLFLQRLAETISSALGSQP
ncbi:MAG: DUF484 family protein [Sideroxydans sp.]|nr:DUF484 family protein [Sideroxydans sp.]